MGQTQKKKGKRITGARAAIRTKLFNKYVIPNNNLVYWLSIEYSQNPADIEENYFLLLENLYRYIESYDTSKPINTWIHICSKRLLQKQAADASKMLYDEFKRTDVTYLTETTTHPQLICEENEGEKSYNSRSKHFMHSEVNVFSDDVLKALNKLSEKCKEALLLQLSGYKLKEIAEILHKRGSLKNKNTETVKTRVLNAKVKMRKYLTQKGELKRKDYSEEDDECIMPEKYFISR